MHSLSVVIIAFMAVITLPALSYATTTEGSELEEPKILPLTDAKLDDDKQVKSVNEIWQEDTHEVVIRKQRGAKENGGTATGKKKERKDKNASSTTTQASKLAKNSDTVVDTNTQEPTIGRKHKHQHQSKHDKSNRKPHTGTIKPEEDGKYVEFTKKHNKKRDSSQITRNRRAKKPQVHEFYREIVFSFADSCRYTKGTWSECDPKSNTRSKTLTLKKGEGSCVQTRTIQKKCKKGKSDKGESKSKSTYVSALWRLHAPFQPADTTRERSENASPTVRWRDWTSSSRRATVQRVKRREQSTRSVINPKEKSRRKIATRRTRSKRVSRAVEPTSRRQRPEKAFPPQIARTVSKPEVLASTDNFLSLNSSLKIFIKN